MNTFQDSKQPDWGKYEVMLSVIGLLVALISLVVGLFQVGVKMEFLLNNWRYLAIALVLMASTAALTHALTRRKLTSKLRQNAETLRQGESKLEEVREILKHKENELEVCQREVGQLKSKPVPYYKRFEQIPRVRYGHIEYPPLLDHTRQGEPIGIGITILKEIFRGNGIEKHDTRMFWEEIETLLYEMDPESPKNYKIDIIATPIFETNDRAQKVSFTSPIFYSEIGLYYSKNNPLFRSLHPMTLDHAIAQIRGRGNDIKFHVIEGELSERMVKKYFSDQLTKNYYAHKSGSMKVPELIKYIAKGNCDVAFVETFQADLQTNFSDTVVNLLRPNQLLYPVAYAMRREDYVLRRYINLKLMEIDIYSGNGGNGITDLIKSELERIGALFHPDDSEDEKMKKMRKYFIREYEI